MLGVIYPVQPYARKVCWTLITLVDTKAGKIYALCFRSSSSGGLVFCDHDGSQRLSPPESPPTRLPLLRARRPPGFFSRIFLRLIDSLFRVAGGLVWAARGGVSGRKRRGKQTRES